jgi:Fur family transcriptional regulator, peroxide stress response regulator
MANKSILKILVKNGLKVTPQRIAILEAILSYEGHPGADNITDYLRISTQIYRLEQYIKILILFQRKELFKRSSKTLIM